MIVKYAGVCKCDQMFPFLSTLFLIVNPAGVCDEAKRKSILQLTLNPVLAWRRQAVTLGTRLAISLWSNNSNYSKVNIIDQRPIRHVWTVEVKMRQLWRWKQVLYWNWKIRHWQLTCILCETSLVHLSITIPIVAVHDVWWCCEKLQGSNCLSTVKTHEWTLSSAVLYLPSYCVMWKTGRVGSLDQPIAF